MRALPVATVLFLFSISIPFSAQAVSITNAQLPATIQACIMSGSCLVNHTSTYSSGQVSAFTINDDSTRARSGTVWGETNDWLVRYDLVAPSSQTNIDNVQTQTFDGYLWMRINSVYLAAETAHPVTVFLDKVTPVPEPLVNQNGDLSLFMTTADMLAGSAYIDQGFFDEVNNYYNGSLSGEVPLICLASGCEIHARLNLVQMSYQNFGADGIYMTGFDSKDTRGLVYTQRHSYFSGEPPYSTTQAFYITPVPEPETYLMFGFGLLSVFTWVWRRNAPPGSMA